MIPAAHDSFAARRTLTAAGSSYDYYALAALAENGHQGVGRLPVTLKILLENLLRGEDGAIVTRADILAVLGWLEGTAPITRSASARRGC